MNPFDLDDDQAYREWRGWKLAHYPATSTALLVPIGDLGAPTATELQRLAEPLARYNMALIRTAPTGLDVDRMLNFGRNLGLRRSDANLFADHNAVSHICRAAETPGGAPTAAPTQARRSDYIPYTDRPLSWHTDGYYNPPERQVLAWMLFCVRPAPQGGANHLLDHEIAYIHLRDASPEHIRALSHPEAFSIPANLQDGTLVRDASVGAVFSVHEGRLHMRYSARGRNVHWRDDPATQAARAELDRLFSQSSVFTFTHTLAAGEGFITNNVLHDRSGFADDPTPERQRLLYRARFIDRIRWGG